MGVSLSDLTPDDGESSDPATRMLERARKARALQSVGVTPAPAPDAPKEVHTDSQGTGFWDTLKANAVQNTQKFLNFVNDKPQPAPIAEPTTGLGKLGQFAAGIADPVNLIGFGAAGAGLDALGVPAMAEKLGGKLAGESVLSKLAAKGATASIEGGAIGAAGSAPTDVLRSVEEGQPYDPSTAPMSTLKGAAMGAVLDPLTRGALEIPGALKAGAENMLAAHTSVVDHHVPEDATWETHDPWANNPPPTDPLNPAQANSGLAGAYEPGKLFVQGALKKFGDRMDVGAPTDEEGRSGVAVDLYRSGTKEDPTLSVGFLRHDEAAPKTQLPGRTDDVQPQPTVRETMGILQHVKQMLVDDPKIKWLDTQPSNTSVMSFLAKFGGQWEMGGDGARMVVPADNIRQGIRGEVSPEMAESIRTIGGEGTESFHPDPFGRQERAIRKGIDPDEKFFGATWAGRDDTASGANPRDPDTGLLAYSGVPVPEVAREGKAFAEGVKGHIEGKLDDDTTPQDPVLNVAKLPIKTEAQERIAAAAEKYRGQKEDAAVPRKDILAEAAALTQELRLKYEKLDPEAASKLTGVELRARTDAITQLDQEIETHQAAEDAATTDVDRSRARDMVDHLRETQDKMIGDLVVGAGQKGRDLRALAYAPDSIAGWLGKARKAAGGPIPEDVQDAIREAHGRRKAAKDPQEKAKAEGDIIKIVEGLKKRPVWQHAVDLFKTAITAPGPIDAANAGGNTVIQVAEDVSQLASSVIDSVVQLFTDARTVAAPTLRGRAKGLAAGVEDAKSIMTTGMSEHAAGKFGAPVGEHFDLAKKLFGDAQAALKTDTILRTYMHYHWRRFGAADAVFREYRLASVLVSEARVKAMNEGVKGPAIDARVSELLKDPSANPTMVSRAIEQAHYSTLNDDNRLADAIHSFTPKLPNYGQAIAQTAVPFVRTVANVANMMIDYTPVLGFLKTVVEEQGRNQRSIVLSLGREATGGGLMALGYYLAKRGSLTGAGPQTSAGKQTWEAQGKGGYRARVGGNWVDYNRMLGPMAMPLAIGADLYEFTQDLDKQGPGQTMGDKLSTLASGPVGMLADQTPGGSLSTFSSHQTEHPITDWLENTAVNVAAPNILGSANLAAGLDNKERATDTFLDRIKSRIPGVRETLPAKVDATGREIPRADGVLSSLIDPTSPKVANDDPALVELQRLGLNYAKPSTVGTYTPEEQMARRQAGVTGNVIPERYDRTPADVRGLSEAAGPETLGMLNQIIAQPNYQQFSDEMKRQVLTGIIGAFRAKNTALYERAHQQPAAPPTWP